jgi:hypothetical protein
MVDVRTRHLTDRLPITFTSTPSRSRRLRNPRSSTYPDREICLNLRDHLSYGAIYRPRARRKIEASLRSPTSRGSDAFSLDIDRYINAVKNLGSHVPKSYRAPEELRMARELLGGSGTVITRDGRIGARFPSAGLLHLAEMSYKSIIYNVGSGGMEL